MTSRALAAGDVAALVLFTMAGLRFHGVAAAPAEVLQTAVPLVVSWLAIAALAHTYRAPRWWRFLTTWLLGVPLGLVIRQLWLGKAFGQGFLVFLGVAMTLTLAAMAAWRLVASVLRPVLARRTPPAGRFPPVTP